MNITADTTRCVGAGQCVLSAPDIFDQDDDALVVLVEVSPGEDELELVRDAVDRCPSQAITLHEG
ncbi:MAG TPA: ferredoxin [Blastococcus sp.]|jgi:ferredoxin